MRLVVAVLFLLLGSFVVSAQQSGVVPIAASPQEKAEFKTFQEAETKAITALKTATDKIPESKALAEAQAKFDAIVKNLPEYKALEAAQSAYKVAVNRLPEKETFDKANSETWDAAYRLLANRKLSSREYEPGLDASGALEFRKKARQ